MDRRGFLRGLFGTAVVAPVIATIKPEPIIPLEDAPAPVPIGEEPVTGWIMSGSMMAGIVTDENLHFLRPTNYGPCGYCGTYGTGYRCNSCGAPQKYSLP